MSNAANFHELINQFDKTILQDFYLRDPFAALVPRTSFITEMGQVPQVLTMTGERPTAYPENLDNVNVTDGPGTPSGDVSATTVQTGQRKRTFQLEVAAWKSGEINTSDMTFRHDRVQVVNNIEETLKEYCLAFTADWHRIKSIAMMDNKAVVTAAGEIEEASNSDSDFSAITTTRQNTAQAGAASTITLDAGASGVDDEYNTQYIYIVSGTGAGQRRQITDYVGASKVATVGSAWTTNPDATSVFRILSSDIPAQDLDWDVLRCIYNNIARVGGEGHAVGFSDGAAVFALTLGPEMKQKLFQADLQTDIRYAMPKENFTVRGITQATMGFVPNLDWFPIRYDENMEKIYPFVNQASTTGQEYIVNPDYSPVSKGGQAVYEVAYIYTRNIWEAQPRPADATSLSRAMFTPQNYTCELKWINNRTYNGANDLGNKGYFRSDWQVAAKPVRSYLGYSVLFKIPSEV